MAAKKQHSPANDRLTEADFNIFRLAKSNVNYFSDYYMRSPTSGTYWYANPDPPDEEKEAAWQVMYHDWKADRRPEDVFHWRGIDYKIKWDDNNDPVFWNHHGWLFIPWQAQAYHAPQPDLVCVGGYGSAKTSYIAAELICRAAMTPYYRGYSVAPKMIQANEVYRAISTVCANTPLFNRWLDVARSKPYPTIILKNKYIGESTIECLSLEHDPDKVLTLEGDQIFVDQAEQFDDLATLIKAVGSRLRGSVHGRPRLGKLRLVANSGDNPELWYLFDMAEHDPATFISFNPSSYDNPYLTKAQLKDMERHVGGTKEAIEQHMFGRRPIGNGEHFSAKMVQQCISRELDDIMDRQMALPDEHPEKREGFYRQKEDRVGIHWWEMPPEPGRHYVVIGDPGTFNPPLRNSPPIMVFDITDFPEQPAYLRAFKWVYGNGFYTPFVQTFVDYANRYRARDRCGFDSTGIQKGFNELVFMDYGLAAEGIDLSVNGKMRAIVALKFFMGKGMIQFPYISHLVNQLTNYRLPDTKIQQDLVMCLAMVALYIRRYYIEEIGDEEDRRPVRSAAPERHMRLPAARDRRYA